MLGLVGDGTHAKAETTEHQTCAKMSAEITSSSAS